MDDAGGQQDDGEPSDRRDDRGPKLVAIAEAGDVVLDVTFLTTKETLKSARKTAATTQRKLGKAARQEIPKLSPKVRVAFRVELSVLKSRSKYFSNLLGNTQFSEARQVKDTLATLTARKLSLADATPQDLPWIEILDDDEASQEAGREVVFEDLLRILHEKPAKTAQVTISFVTALALLADRFDCAAAVGRSLSKDLKFKWPITKAKAGVSGDLTPRKLEETEKVLRQKILIACLLEQPLRLHNATRELIIRGSCRWGYLPATDSGPARTGSWWDLPRGLEAELQYRRECVLNTIASVQRHFLALYSSREQQCQLGYDTSPACDVFQLGQMLKFFTNRNLMWVVDFGPASFDAVPDSSARDIDEILTTMQQCPSYQIDKHHTNCGLRTRLEPILDYIRSMLSSNVVSIGAEWKKRTEEGVSWIPTSTGEKQPDVPEKKFEFTRQVAGDSRLKIEGAMYTDRMARKLFTADSWDWTPEY